MIVHEIDVPNVTLLKSENDPPIGADGDRPKASKIAFQRMKSKAGTAQPVKIISRGIQRGENITNALHHIGRELAGVIVCVELPQALMSEALDHPDEL
jgi:hypothetical protein